MTCEFCGQEKPDVEVQSDPFAWEVNGDDWRVPMCGGCVQARADEA
jgi:hypothetical protein